MVSGSQEHFYSPHSSNINSVDNFQETAFRQNSDDRLLKTEEEVLRKMLKIQDLTLSVHFIIRSKYDNMLTCKHLRWKGVQQ